MWIVSGSKDGILYVWSVQDGSLISGPLEGHIGPVTSVKFSPDGTHIVSAGGFYSSTVGIWNSNDATVPMGSFTGHEHPANSVDFSPDGTRIVSGSDDGTVRVWDLSSRTTIFIIQRTIAVEFVRFTPDGTHIISTSYGLGDIGRKVHTWDASDGSQHNPTIEPYLDRASPIAISPDGDSIAFVHLSGDKIHVWNRHTGKPIAGPFLYSDFIRCVALSFSDDSMRLVSAFNGNMVQVWNAYERVEQAKPPSQKLNWKGIRPYFAISPNQARVAEALESSINIRDLETAALINSIPILPDPGIAINAMQFSLDGTRIFIVYDTGQLCTWQIDTAELIDGPHFCATTRDRLESAECLSDGTRVATCSSGKIELWDVQSHRSIVYLELDEYDRLSYRHSPRVMFSQSGRNVPTNVAYAPRSILHVWDASNGTCLAGPFLIEEPPNISPDGTLILCRMSSPSIYRGLLHLINVDKGETTCLTETSTNNARSSKVVFSNDGLYVVSASPSQCKIWDIHNQATTAIQPAWTHNLQSFSYSLNGWCRACSTLQFGKDVYFQSWRFRIDQPFCTTIDSNGWLRDTESRPLLWVPAEISMVFPRGNGFCIANAKSLHVDYNDMLVGDKWSKCYIGD